MGKHMDKTDAELEELYAQRDDDERGAIELTQDR